MKNFSEIVESIMKIKGFRSESKLAEFFGLHSQALNRYKKQNKMPFETIIEFCERENVSLDWLLLGRGSEKPLPENMGTSAIDELIQFLETFKKTKETK